MAEKKRLFFAVNLPEPVKEEIAEKVLPLIPKEGWKPVSKKNLHVTIHFLGYLPAEALKKLRDQAEQLESFEAFEAELNCAGHFKGRVLWLGFGKGSEQFNLLNRKLQQAIGTHDERFHAHVTLARNKGAKGKQPGNLVEQIRKTWQPRKLQVNGIDLMESRLRKSGPEYSILFSVKFTL